MPQPCRHRVNHLHRDGEQADSIHGVTGIDQQVDQCGFKLADVSLCKAAVIGGAALLPNFHLRAQQRAHQIKDVLRMGIDVEHFRAQRLLARKSEQLVG